MAGSFPDDYDQRDFNRPLLMARILVIEDEPDLRVLFRLQLTGLGHTVIEAPNGKAGLEQFHATSPDLVLTDLMMPVMEGLEAIPLLKRAQPSLKIIAMSGGGTNPAGSYLRMAQRLGASYTLAKPFSLAELDTAVSVLLAPPPPERAPFYFLVLDDDVTSRLLNRSLLESAFPRSTVIECGSVDAAIAASTKHHLDAVISDHHLGQTDAGEFLRTLRRQGASCPVLMVTGSSDPNVHARAYEAGATRVFSGQGSGFIDYLRHTLMAD